MRTRRLLQRRLGAHPVALASVAVSVAASMAVVTGLQLLTEAVADAGVQSVLDVPTRERSVAVSAALDPGALSPVDDAVREEMASLPGGTVTRVASAPTRGMPGRSSTDRALLADVDGVRAATDLLDGRWPRRPSDAAAEGSGRVEVSLPSTAAERLGLEVGDALVVSDIVDDAAPEVTLVLTGIFRPRSPDDALWVDLPLALQGVTESDFTTYGPFVTAPGAFDGPLVGASTVTWRLAADVGGTTRDRLPGLERAVDRTVRELRRTVGLPLEAGDPETEEPSGLPLRSPRVVSDLPALLDSARGVADRTRVTLLTPTVLVVLLGLVALVGASGLLASLRTGDVRLLRLRGASSSRLGALALGEAIVIAGAAAPASALAGAVGIRALTGQGWGSLVDDVRDPALWAAVLPLAAVVVAVTTATSTWAGREGAVVESSGRGTRSGLLAAAAAGLDLVLVGLGVVGVIQLRRYDAAGSTTVDPLTAAAPALVVAGLVVLALRLLPVLARLVARSGDRRAGLSLAWGGWQFARRTAGQTGTIVLVLLAASMGSVALSQVATAEQAFEDQSAFEAGAALRVGQAGGVNASGTGGTVTETLDADVVMPATRREVGLGDLDDVTVLAVDSARAGEVMDVRPDTVSDGSWPAVVGRLTASRDLGGGLVLPPGTRQFQVTVRAALPPDAVEDYPAVAHVRDGRGVVRTVPAGSVTRGVSRLAGDVADLESPVALVGVAAALPEDVRRAAQPGERTAFDVRRVTADGEPLAGVDAFSDESTLSALWWTADPAPPGPVAAVVTREVAEAIGSAGSAAPSLSVGSRDVPLEVVGVLDVLPTAAVPTRGVLVDLPQLAAVPTRTGGDGVQRSRVVVEPDEWWAHPGDPAEAAADLEAAAPFGTTILERSALAAERRADPVNRGMRVAMLLVAAASVLIATLGFAASTAGLGRVRRHENAVLFALGMPPRRIRAVMVVERGVVVALTVLTGLVVGVVAAIVVVAFLVGSDGHAQVPVVRPVVPTALLAGYTATVAAILVAAGVAVLGRSVGDPTNRSHGGGQS
ncbi:hypothetical protein KC207_00940 [Phycicoccus sp. BSK3Z-2]|uniref:FtsX-like permease family protein n=1 Tax=Phycicoccus avicenniae TaxID=2828860 RepID=A0A941D666_9MICO|nr:FtsX-like permease family protein [Phycicoccus avicenniae]MBR7741858.1 hypothetical protein [Phycicoccus avicenniae]